MSRLKKVANNVSPNMHREVEKHIKDPAGNRWRVQQSQDAFLIAKRLLAALPIVPTNERVYELAQDIVIGSFEDICPVEEAENEENWEAWKQRTIDLLKSRNIFI